MTEKTDESTSLQPWIMMLPFAEQLFCIILFVLLAPSVFGIFLIYLGKLAYGFAVLSIWIAAFAWFAVFRDRKKIVRLWISIPLALLAVFGAIYAFFAP
jgi:hypothetical protein